MKPSCWKEIFVTGVNKKKVKASEAVVARKRRKNKIRKQDFIKFLGIRIRSFLLKFKL